MSTNLECRERKRNRKEKVGDRLAELNEKKSDRELEARDKKTKETNFVGRTTWYTGGEKYEMRTDKR